MWFIDVVASTEEQDARDVRPCARAARRYISPVLGYSILRQNRLGAAGAATGLAKVSATASHSSGLSAPRRRMSSLLSSESRVRAS